jgi:fimbrial chaperone protein
VAVAGEFSVTPVRIFMEPRDRATAVTIANEGREELVMQADIYAWKQKPGGEDELTLTEDLFLSPPIIKLAPNARQVVRLARLQRGPVEGQQTYRMLVRELTEARARPQGQAVEIALAFSLPVFITPAGARSLLDCDAHRAATDKVRIECRNQGNAYVFPREFTLTSAQGEPWAARDSGGYILPGVERAFELQRSGGGIPGGSAKLAVTLDDGSIRNFDVRIAE